jgi:hypothetical protein
MTSESIRAPSSIDVIQARNVIQAARDSSRFEHATIGECASTTEERPCRSE